jgi:hypothetical protein
MTSECAWKNNPSRKNLRKPTSPAKGNGPIPETPPILILEAFSAWRAKTPKRIHALKLTHRVWSQAHPVLLIPTRGEAVGAEEVEAGAEAEAEAEAITRKENGTAFFTRKTMTIAQTIAQIRKGSKLSSRKRGRRKKERVL